LRFTVNQAVNYDDHVKVSVNMNIAAGLSCNGASLSVVELTPTINISLKFVNKT